MFRYFELTLPAPLSPHIRAVWHLESDAEPANAEPIVPDGCVEIVLSFADPMIEHPIGGVPDRQDPQFVVGQLARPTIVAPTGRVDIWGIRLQPSPRSWPTSVIYPMRRAVMRSARYCGGGSIGSR